MSERVRILVVDDDASMRRVLTALLSRDGHVVTTAASGPEALRELEADCFSLVLSDIRMDPMDGVALLRTVLARYPGLPVILLSAYYDEQTACDVMARGARGFVPKPFTRDRLMTAVQGALPGAGAAWGGPDQIGPEGN